jgi:nucleoside-diphosphate-sugar epimerase
MKILVIGGTRFFGKRFVSTCIEKKYEVTLLTRGQTLDPFENKVRRLKADRTQKDQFSKAVKNESFDIVLDQTCMTASDAKIAIDTLKGNIKHFVMTSTLSVYPQKANLKETEVDTVNYRPQTATNASEEYSQGKQAAEQQYLTQKYFTVGIARIPMILGPDDYTKRLLKHVDHIKNGKELYFPNLEAKFSYLSSQDAANALMWLCVNKKIGVYNFSSPDQWTLKELVEKIQKITGKKLVAAKKGDDQNYSPFGISEDYYMNVGKAEAEGFKVQSLNAWMPELIKYLANN